MKKLILVTLASASLLALTACASSSKEATSDNSKSNTLETQKKVDTAPFQVGKDMMKNERVYYEASYDDEDNPLGVNTKIEKMYIFKKGKVSAYDVTSDVPSSKAPDDITLGSLKGLNQREILNKIVSNNKKAFDVAKEETKKINPNVPLKAEYIEPNWQNIKIEALTDPSGNTIAEERISAKNINISGGYVDSVPIREDATEGDPGEPAGGLDGGDKNSTISFTLSNYKKGAFSVFNQNYAFFDEGDEGSGTAFITANNSSALPELDSLDENFVKVQTESFDDID